MQLRRIRPAVRAAGGIYTQQPLRRSGLFSIAFWQKAYTLDVSYLLKNNWSLYLMDGQSIAGVRRVPELPL